MSLLREIQNDLATAAGDVTIVLRKCKVLAARLGSDEFARWVEYELNGYPESQPTPDYRRLGISYYARFMNIAWQEPRRPVPLQLIPEEYGILDFSLKIEDENPDAGEAPANTRPVPREKLQPLVQNVFYGAVGAVAQNSEHFSQTVNAGMQVQDLTRLVTELANHLNELGLDERQTQRAEAQIAALKAELAGEPDPAIVKQAGRTLRNITGGAMGSLLATAAQPTVWHWIHLH